jgi:hypothetical protein
MKKHDYEALILRMESYLECWKQLHHFMTIARTKKFSQDDENQFLELKSVITQEFEILMATLDCGTISRDEVHALLASGPSIRFLSELNEGALRNIESQWHKLFISFQAILGQLKVRQQQAATSKLKGWFGRKAA